MVSFSDFQKSFAFNRNLVFSIGIEREGFLFDHTDQVAPQAVAVLNRFPVGHPYEHTFGPELSACQIESRTQPTTDHRLLRAQLLHHERVLATHLDTLGLTIRYIEVGPVDMPLVVYPDSAGRYAQLKKQLPTDTLRAACRVAGTHIHVGMPDLDTALRVYNGVRQHCAELIRLGDRSNGERLRLYRQVTSEYFPVPYESPAHFHRYAVALGFAGNLRNCWHLIRITRYGTIEFRLFGTTENIQQILDWSERCKSLCRHYQ